MHSTCCGFFFAKLWILESPKNLQGCKSFVWQKQMVNGSWAWSDGLDLTDFVEQKSVMVCLFESVFFKPSPHFLRFFC